MKISVLLCLQRAVHVVDHVNSIKTIITEKYSRNYFFSYIWFYYGQNLIMTYNNLFTKDFTVNFFLCNILFGGPEPFGEKQIVLQSLVFKVFRLASLKSTFEACFQLKTWKLSYIYSITGTFWNNIIKVIYLKSNQCLILWNSLNDKYNIYEDPWKEIFWLIFPNCLFLLLTYVPYTLNDNKQNKKLKRGQISETKIYKIKWGVFPHF